LHLPSQFQYLLDFLLFEKPFKGIVDDLDFLTGNLWGRGIFGDVDAFGA
jgi:hypothetical protein